MFQIMSATFDEGGASGLLLNHLRCYDDRQLLVLDSGTEVPVVEEKTGQLEAQSQSQTGSVAVADVRGKGTGEKVALLQLRSVFFWCCWMSSLSTVLVKNIKVDKKIK